MSSFSYGLVLHSYMSRRKCVMCECELLGLESFEPCPEKARSAGSMRLTLCVGVLCVLLCRYKSNVIHTFVADILLVINPYKRIQIYGSRYKERYNPSDPLVARPHVYAIAQAAAKNLKLLKRNQVCLISGESGAGKTETAKYFMNHLLHFSGCGAGSQNALERKILESQPLLEAFGNAKTGLNDNSSRFGKFMEVLYEGGSSVVGARIQKYLLEKSRVVGQAAGETNYHIFFYLSNGSPQSLRDTLNISDSSTYKFLSASETSTDDVARYMELDGTMKLLGFHHDEISAMWTILAVVLKSGQLTFVDNEGDTDDSSRLADDAIGRDIADTLQVDFDMFQDALTTKHIVTAGETFHKPLDAKFATETRDTFAQNMYDNLFSWLTRRLNVILSAATNTSDLLSVGVLDIFGFENFESNSFEQMCINTANEQLQYFFNQHIFQWEMKELKQEGIRAPTVEFKDNFDQVEILLSKPSGIFSILDEQAKVPRSSDQSTITKLHNALGKRENYDDLHQDRLQFQLTHYAGPVKYQIKGFLDKNRNTKSLGVVGMVQSSKIAIAAGLFDEHESTSDRRNNVSTGRSGSSRLKKRKTLKQRASKFFGRGKKKASTKPRFKDGLVAPSDTRAKKSHLGTLGGEFRSSLEDLMLKLNAASPHFIRCIKPVRNPIICRTFVLVLLAPSVLYDSSLCVFFIHPVACYHLTACCWL